MNGILLSKYFVQPVVIALITFVLCYISRRIVYKLFSISRRHNDKKKKTIVNLISNVIIIFLIVIGLILILQVFNIDTASFVASLGVFSLVIGLALQDLLKDIFSGIMIILEGQYNIGDWVEVNQFKGEIIASSLRTTKLRAYTGEIKIIANRQINELINYSLAKTTVIVDINVSYDADVDMVRDVINNLAIKLKKEGKVADMECLGLQRLDNSSIVFRVITHTNHSDKIPKERILNEAILKAFKENGIEIPYQQVVIHNGKRI